MFGHNYDAGSKSWCLGPLWCRMSMTIFRTYSNWFHTLSKEIARLCLFPVNKSTWQLLLRRQVEPRHDKTNKMSVRPAKTQIRPVWSESSLAAWRKLGSLATHGAYSEDTDQTGRMPRLIWVFAWRIATLLVLSCRGSVVGFDGLK